MPSSATNLVLQDLKSGAVPPDAELVDNLEILARSPAFPTSVIKLTLAKIRQYLGAVGSLIPSGGTTGQALVKNSNADGDFIWGTVTGGTTSAVTFDNTGTGAASGASFNGTAAIEVSYNTVGAQKASSLLSAYAAAPWTAGSQIPVLTAANTITLIPIGATAGHVLDKASGDSLYQPIGSYLTANQNISCTGDVTGTGTTAITLTIANSAVTLAKMANLPANTIIGNNTGAAAAPIALTAAQLAAMLPTFTLTANGLVPAPTTATGKFLQDNGTWAVPSAGASTLAADTDVSITSPSDGQVLTYDGPASKWKNKAATGGSTGTSPLTIPSKEQFAPPAPALFPTVVNASGTVAPRFIGNSGGATVLGYNESPTVTGDKWKMRLKAAPAGKVIIGRMEGIYPETNFAGGGFVLRNSSTGKFIHFGIFSDSGQNFVQLRMMNWTNETTFSANVTMKTNLHVKQWYKVDWSDSTNVKCYISADAVDWVQVATQTLAAFIGSIDQVGFGINENYSSGGALNNTETATNRPEAVTLNIDYYQDSDIVPVVNGYGGSFLNSNNGLTLLAAQTVSAVSQVVFDNTKITTQFSNYLIRVTNGVFGSGSAWFMIQLSPDNGTTIRSASYQDCYENWGITTNFQQYIQNAVTNGMPIGVGNTDTTLPFNGEVILHGLLNASVKKFARANGVIKANDGNLYDHRHASYYNVAEAINYLKIVSSAGGTFSGTFELYGINDTPAGGGKRLIPFFFTTAPAASEVMAIYACSDIFTIPANLVGTQVKKQTSGANPAADLVFTVYQNSTSIGTITIHSDGSVTLAGAGCTTAVGDVISVVAPATPQPAAQNWAINLVGGL